MAAFCEEFEMVDFRKRSGRPQNHPVEKLAHRAWAAMLWDGAVEHGSVPGPEGWAALENRLLRLQLGEEFPSNPEATSLRSVARYGTNPRRLSWQLEANELHARLLPGLHPITRKAPGRRAGSEPRRTRSVFAVPFDAVELGERLLPGSSAWLDAPLWWLAAAHSPPVDLVRECVQWALRTIGVVQVSIHERRSLLGEHAYQEALHASDEVIYAAHEAMLRGMAHQCSPGWLTLVAGLVWESYLTDQDDLLRIHESVASEAFDRWLAVPALASLRDVLREKVVIPILCRGPVEKPRSTDPRDVLISESDWSRHVLPEVPYRGSFLDLNFIDDDDELRHPSWMAEKLRG